MPTTIQTSGTPGTFTSAPATDESNEKWYDVFIKAGSPAVPGVDPAHTRVSAVVNTLAVVVGSLLPANAVVFVSIWAGSIRGYAEAGAEFSFPTDGSGKPLLVPSPVTNLRARALPSGKILVTWEYDEPLAITPADHFEIDFVFLDLFGISPATISVPHVAPQREYSATSVELAEGRWRCKVRSVSAAGQTLLQPPTVTIRADASGPSHNDVALSVSE